VAHGVELEVVEVRFGAVDVCGDSAGEVHLVVSWAQGFG
jgi:hypothetical protein